MVMKSARFVQEALSLIAMLLEIMFVQVAAIMG
jgi:hypothetical protein